MKHSDFKMNMEFMMNDEVWRVTDIGIRTVIVIRLGNITIGGFPKTRTMNRIEAESEGWFNGPPYAVQELVFDEDDLPACEPIE